LVRDVRSAQIKAALDREMSFIFDLLGDELSENDLLGEVLASDHDAGLVGATGEQKNSGDNDSEVKDPALSRQRTARQGRGTLGI